MMFVLRMATPVLAAAAALLAHVPAGAQETYTLKVANFTPAGASSSRWFEQKKKELAEKTDGKLQLQMYYGSSMGPLPRHYDLARTGVSDMSFFQHGVTRGRFPLVELTHLPYLFPPGAKGSVVGAKVAADLMEEYLGPEHKGTKPIWIVYNRPSGVYDSSKPIRTVADLKGRRYRTPTPTDAEMLKLLGGVPIGMPATEMAESLQKGTLDGVVTDPMGIFAFKMSGLVKYYTPTFVSAISFGLAMNPESYKKLPAEYRELIDQLGTKESAVKMASLSWGDFPAFLDYMEKANIEDVPLSPEADAEMRKAAQKVVEEKLADLEDKGLPAREVYGKMKELSAKYAAE